MSSEVPSSEIDEKMLAAYVVHGDDGDGLGDSGDLYAGIAAAIYGSPYMWQEKHCRIWRYSCWRMVMS